MAIKPIKQLTFQKNQYPELIAKLNAVAPFCYIKVHQLAKQILMRELDKMIEQYGIDINYFMAQSARTG